MKKHVSKFYSFFRKKTILTAISVLYNVPMHNVAQLFQVSSAELHGPQNLDGGNQLGDRGDILLFQEILHMVLIIFNWIKVRAVARPIHISFGKVAQPGSLDPLGGIAQCIVLQKLYAATQSGCFHNSLCCFLEESRQTTKPQSARKTTPKPYHWQGASQF
jgi:hypothetical protein